MNKLDEICTKKREHVASAKQRVPFSALEGMLADAPAPRPFAERLQAKAQNGQIGLIAEIKKASPSKGLIRADFQPAQLAKAYADAGAACLSVLTDAPYFQGDDSYLQQAREACELPVLRKDFMVDPYQITESRALGADCVLLIMAALDDFVAQEMEAHAMDLGMSVLVETHDESELERALKYLKSPLLGVNNRSLKTLEVSLDVTEHLVKHIPADKTPICESGIYTPADIARMQALNIHCFLVGESLMRQPDVRAATQQLIGG